MNYSFWEKSNLNMKFSKHKNVLGIVGTACSILMYMIAQLELT